MGINIKRKWLWSVITLLLAVLTIGAVIRGSQMSSEQLLEGIRTAKRGWLFLAALASLGFVFFEGQAVLTILRAAGYRRGPSRGFVYAAADFYFSAITPSATGGQPGSAFFMMQDGVPAAVTAATLLVNLVLYNAAILTIGAFCLVTRPGIFWHFEPGCRVLIILGILVLTGMGVVFFMLLWRQRIVHRIAKAVIAFLARCRLMKNPEKWNLKLEKTMEEYKACVGMMAGQRYMWVRAFLYNILQRMSLFFVTVFVFLAIGGGQGRLFDLWVTQFFVSLGSNCVPIPGSMGVTDYLMLDGYLNLMSRNMAYHLQLMSRGMSFYCCMLVCILTIIVAYVLLRRRK